MSKTPEQMAEEWSETQFREQDFIGPKLGTERAFLAGYQAAMNSPEKQDSCEHILDMEKMVDADKVKFCVYCNDMHKGNCAVGKGKNHPALTQPQWISVKERLPEEGDDLSIMLVWRNIEHDYDTVRWRYQQGWDCVIQDKSTITHWMPLPEPPKE